MSSKQSTVDFIVEQIESAGRISFRKMFGEYAIYCDGKVPALICDDQLLVKPTEAGRAFLRGNVVDGYPFPGATAWFLISGDMWDDREWMTNLIRITASELVPPKKKTKKPKTETAVAKKSPVKKVAAKKPRAKKAASKTPTVKTLPKA